MISEQLQKKLDLWEKCYFSLDEAVPFKDNLRVYPVLVKEYNSTDEVVHDGKEKAIDFAKLNKGDYVIITGGFPNTGNKITNFMKIEEI